MDKKKVLEYSIVAASTLAINEGLRFLVKYVKARKEKKKD